MPIVYIEIGNSMRWHPSYLSQKTAKNEIIFILVVINLNDMYTKSMPENRSVMVGNHSNNETIGKHDRQLITPPIEKGETKGIRGNGPSGEFRNQFP
jgi:hypothetical protein